jgi:hypothetical protein
MTTYPKMGPVWKDWWLRALRGGKYKQGRGGLRGRTGECCCLGVLCDGVGPKWWFGDAHTGFVHADDAGKPGVDVLRLAGLGYNVVPFLIKVNDFDHWKFPRIADWIEANL